jgi:IclR family transcriptional regulator, pca regulon regulatory protein
MQMAGMGTELRVAEFSSSEGDREEVCALRITPREGRSSLALERGLAILECFTPERPLLGIRELAELLDLSPGTTYRHVRTLASEGYLEQDAPLGKYRLALGAIDLGMAALGAMGLCMHARSYLEELSEGTGYTVQLGVLDGLEVLVVAEIAGTRRGQSQAPAGTGRVGTGRVGSRLPAHCTSLGKVLLAFLISEQRLKLISEMELLKHGPRTVTSKAALVRQLEDVRAEGLGIDDEELMAASCAIAAPVRDECADVVAAVSVMAQNGAIELEALEARVTGQLIATAKRISTRLGWHGAEA